MNITLLRGKIDEYDMFSSNVSIMVEQNLISDEMYQNLVESHKDLRNITIGILLKTAEVDKKTLIEILDEQVKYWVNQFIIANKIKDDQILEIAKDAIFTYNVSAKKTSLGNYIRFRKKASYLGYISFPISDTNNNLIKLYLRFGDPICRGSRIDREHIAYLEFSKLLNAVLDRNTKVYNRVLGELKKKLSKEDIGQLIKHVDNDFLIKVFKEIDII